MNTKMNEQLLGPDQIEIAVEILLRGGIVAFPTDTVYGIGALPTIPSALEKLFIAKRRPREKAIPILLADAADLRLVVREPGKAALALAERFWPGALTIVLDRRNPGLDDLDSVAVRVPALALARALIRAAGGALGVTSANISGGSNSTTAQEVVRQLHGRVDAVLDGGRCPGGVESTVVDARREPVTVLRSGGVVLGALRQVVAVKG